ncbi:unnamed protein product [Linum trigynum]|uniref:Uncharacterized protein n=2 Tax=Linum trigynum TaxID=586398 RepID=A0AAV2E7M9_9ROSI
MMQSSMGEIDTKHIESVQVALTIFEEKGDNQKKFAPTRSTINHTNSILDQAAKEGKDMNGLSKELSNCKLQLEAKDSEQSQLLHRIEHYKNTVEQLTLVLQNCESDKEFHIQQHHEATLRLNELEPRARELGDQAVKLREQLSDVLHQLKCSQDEMLGIQAELAALKDEKNKALARAEAMESMSNSNKGRAEELLKQVADAQVEMALVKSELIKMRSKVVVAEAVEARAKKQGGLGLVKRPMHLTPTPQLHGPQHNIQCIASEGNNSTDENCEGGGGKVMISLADYEALVERASTANQSLWKGYDQSASELRAELEGAMSKIGDLRTRAEQAVTRADAAEKAKVEVEEALRKLRERKQKRKAALAALREESLSAKFIRLPTTATTYCAPNKSVESSQPLGKILNLTY